MNGRIIFQRNGDPPHSTRELTEFLNTHFLQNWIERFGSLKQTALEIFNILLWK